MRFCYVFLSIFIFKNIFAEKLETATKIIASPCGIPVTSIDISNKLDAVLNSQKDLVLTEEQKYQFYLSNWDKALMDTVMYEAMLAKAENMFRKFVSSSDVEDRVLKLKDKFSKHTNKKVGDIATKEIAFEMFISECIQAPSSLEVRPNEIRNAYLEYLKEMDQKNIFTYVIVSSKEDICVNNVKSKFETSSDLGEFITSCKMSFGSNVEISEKYTNPLSSISNLYSEIVKTTPVNSISNTVTTKNGFNEMVIVLDCQKHEPVAFEEMYENIENFLIRNKMIEKFNEIQKEIISDFKIKSSIKTNDKVFALK